MHDSAEYLNIKQASAWATAHTGKTVTSSNIAYLTNYGRVPKTGDNGGTLIAKQDLIEYYKSYQREADYKEKLGSDLNWAYRSTNTV